MMVVFVLAWAFWEINPPTPRDLIEEFQSRAVNTDTNFSAIFQRARELQKQAQTPGQAFASLHEAIGTNNITRYFQFANVAAILSQGLGETVDIRHYRSLIDLV